MTRGQCGWLTLHWQGLAPFNTLPAFPGAPERRASGAAGSGSEARADAGSRRLQALVRPRMALGSQLWKPSIRFPGSTSGTWAQAAAYFV